MNVADIAESFHVTGRVCNRSDGSVQLVAQGERDELEQFHQAILLRMSRNVIDHYESLAEVRGGCYLNFEIAADDSL